MDVDEFLEKTSPSERSSRLAPFWGDIKKLRDRNRTLIQVCDFLRMNGVEITIPGLSKYIQRREEKEKKGGNPATASHAETNTINRPKAEPSTRTTGSVKTALLVDPTSSNPLKALSGSRELGEFNPIPTAKIEIDE